MIHNNIPSKKGFIPTFFNVSLEMLVPIRNRVTTSPCLDKMNMKLETG